MRTYILYQPKVQKSLDDPGVQFRELDLNEDGRNGMFAAVRSLYPRGTEAEKHIQFSDDSTLRRFFSHFSRVQGPEDLEWTDIKNLVQASDFLVANGETTYVPATKKRFVVETNNAVYQFNSPEFMSGFRAIIGWMGQIPENYLIGAVKDRKIGSWVTF